MPQSRHPTDAHAKALALNLDDKTYGTFAEIGAGQEVARWFLRVGAASGTVAQTISAYDKTFSDQTYGAGTRYVSKERLLAMLEHEYALLINRLSSTRRDTRFFVFADTIATRNYKGDNDQHGWIGICFQAEPGAQPSRMLLHVNLMERTAQQQQESIGVLGVNLVYGAFHQRDSIDDFLGGLSDGLSLDRVEVDVIEHEGPAFIHVDARIANIRALERGMCHALVLDKNGNLVEPASALRKRPLIVERGRFDTIEAYQSEMLRTSLAKLKEENILLERAPAAVLEVTTHHATAADTPAEQVLERACRAAPMADAVIISDFAEYYRLTAYLRRFTREPIRMAVGVSMLVQLLNDRFYRELPGALLEGIAKFLATNVKIHVHPMPAESFRRVLQNVADESYLSNIPEGRVTAADIHPPPPLDHLYRFLRQAGWIVEI